MSLAFSSNEEKKVFTKDGREIGLLSGSILDTGNWTVSLLQVQVAKDLLAELGKKKRFHKVGTIQFAPYVVAAVGDVIQLNVDMKDLPNHLRD